LWVIHRELAKVQLRVVGIPALRANQQLIVAALDDFALQLGQLKPLIATVALGN
jgi:hypothetical protein